MLELQFESQKYKHIIANAKELQPNDKELLIMLIGDYFKAKGKLKFSESWTYNFRLNSAQQAALESIMLNSAYTYKAKQLAQSILKQTFILQNSTN